MRLYSIHLRKNLKQNTKFISFRISFVWFNIYWRKKCINNFFTYFSTTRSLSNPFELNLTWSDFFPEIFAHRNPFSGFPIFGHFFANGWEVCFCWSLTISLKTSLGRTTVGPRKMQHFVKGPLIMREFCTAVNFIYGRQS